MSTIFLFFLHIEYNIVCRYIYIRSNPSFDRGIIVGITTTLWGGRCSRLRLACCRNGDCGENREDREDREYREFRELRENRELRDFPIVPSYTHFPHNTHHPHYHHYPHCAAGKAEPCEVAPLSQERKDFLSEWCRCGADMKMPPMGSTWRTSHWWH